MTYYQLREEIWAATHQAVIEGGNVTPHNKIMTSIDTYLEDKAVEVESAKKHDVEYTRTWLAGFFTAVREAAAIVRSKE